MPSSSPSRAETGERKRPKSDTLRGKVTENGIRSQIEESKTVEKDNSENINDLSLIEMMR